MANRFTVEAVFKAVDQWSGVMGRMQASTDALIARTETGLKRVDKFNDRISGGLKRASMVATGAAVATAAVVVDIVKTGAAFDKVLVGAAAKFDPAIRRGTEGFEELRMVAEKIGEDTEFNAQQAAEGLKSLASAGFSTKAAIAGLPAIVDLATASEVSLDEASEMATKSLGAFNMKSEDAAIQTANLKRITDRMAFTAGKTEASMSGLFESIKEGGPVATAAGQSLETFMAMAGRLAAAGIEGSVAGTTLKNVFTSFSTKKGQGALKAIGIKTMDANGKMLDAIDILGELEKKTKTMGSGKRLALLEGIFGKIPLAGVSTLLDQGIKGLRDLREEEKKATGTTKTLADTMRDTVMGDLDELSSKIDGVKIALFTTNNVAIRDVIQGMTKWVAANKELIVQKVGDTLKWISDNIESIATWGKRLGYTVAAFWAFNAVVKTLILTVEGYQAAVVIAEVVTKAWKGSVTGLDSGATAIGKMATAMKLYSVEAAAAETGTKGIRAGLNEGGLGKLINGIGETKIGFVALAAAAALVGWEIGSWLNDVFKLDAKLADMLGGMFKTKSDKARDASLAKAGGQWVDGKPVSDDQYLADGSIRRADGTWVKKTAARVEKERRAAEKLSQGMLANTGRSPLLVEVPVQAVPVSSDGEPFVFGQQPAPQVVSPAERVASSISETSTTSRAELVIKDETGRAELSSSQPTQNISLNLSSSGAFQ